MLGRTTIKVGLLEKAKARAKEKEKVKAKVKVAVVMVRIISLLVVPTTSPTLRFATTVQKLDIAAMIVSILRQFVRIVVLVITRVCVQKAPKGLSVRLLRRYEGGEGVLPCNKILTKETKTCEGAGAVHARGATRRAAHKTHGHMRIAQQWVGGSGEQK